MNEVEWVVCGGGNVYFVYGKQSWFLWSYMDQEHNSDQDDTSQPAGETQLSAASLVSPFVSVKPNT